MFLSRDWGGGGQKRLSHEITYLYLQTNVIFYMQK